MRAKDIRPGRPQASLMIERARWTNERDLDMVASSGHSVYYHGCRAKEAGHGKSRRPEDNEINKSLVDVESARLLSQMEV